MSFRTILLLLVSVGLLFGFFAWATGDKKSSKSGLIAFYNVENLFDTIDDPHKADNDFLPGAVSNWNSERYRNKQRHIAQVVTALDEEGLVLLGLAEIENSTVVEELLQSPQLAAKHYHYVHEESKDPRGIDVALVYNSTFRPLFHKVLKPCKDHECLESRDILAVKGILKTDTVWVFVNHWPSRRSGVEASQGKRMLLSTVLKQAVDSVLIASPYSKIIIMGDFNDTPYDPSIQFLLKNKSVFNPFEAVKTGSIKY
jgi:predicted extracellular nuclease